MKVTCHYYVDPDSNVEVQIFFATLLLLETLRWKIASREINVILFTAKLSNTKTDMLWRKFS